MLRTYSLYKPSGLAKAKPVAQYLVLMLEDPALTLLMPFPRPEVQVL